MACSIDNSAWMRNGDYPPTRMSAQAEAVNYLGGVKTQANEENAVGVLTMAGKRYFIHWWKGYRSTNRLIVALTSLRLRAETLA